ncbi:hypothetical protein LPJ75_005190 [Coemansia sp. RSA 2598]|nr:hypothetical protein LPJ75_005190 [Coemansia sp. RSA 2598]
MKRPRSEAAESPSARSLRSELARAQAETQSTMPPPPAPVLRQPAPATRDTAAAAAAATSAVSAATAPASSANEARSHTPSRAAQPAWRAQMRSNSVSNSSIMPVPSTSVFGAAHHSGEAVSVVERTRLEKVERELHRLKKIIASLIPEELNDDDLRSVYGDLEQPRLNSEDIVARLMKTRLGPHISAYTDRASMGGGFRIPNAIGLPPSPISASPTQTGDQQSRPVAGTDATMMLPPPPPPKLPPLAQGLGAAESARKSLSSADLPVSPLLSAESAFASYGGRGYGSRRLKAGIAERPLSIASLRRKAPEDDESSTASADGGVAKRQRPSPEAPAKRSNQQPPPPPHKDPGVMSKLLQEMKHHKLRTVKKPKDMVVSSSSASKTH